MTRIDGSNGVVGVGLIGLGTVGGGVAEMLKLHRLMYAHRLGRSVELRRVLVRDVAKAKARDDISVDASLITDDAEAFFATDEMSIVAEAAGGLGPVEALVRRTLETGRHVVTANKALLAAKGSELFALARQHGVSIAFEASCGGGIPCVTAIQFGLMANDVLALRGILNGTCNYILTRMTREGMSYIDALAEAQRLGYAEADPTMDVSGRDSAQKLAILTSLAFGQRVDAEVPPCRGIDTLEGLDLRLGAEMGYDLKLLSTAEVHRADDGGPLPVALETGPCFVKRDTPLAGVRGAFNAVEVVGDYVGPTLFYGQGAGRGPTASAMVSDILNVASGWYPAAFASMRLTPDLQGHPPLLAPDEHRSRFYLRVMVLDRPGVMARVTGVLGELNISLSAMLQHEAEEAGGKGEGGHVPVVILTHEAKRGDVRRAVERIAGFEDVAGEPVVIRVVDG